MKWFKFYGQDYLTDPKMRSLSVFERQCWIVLLCLANAEEKNGKICYISEDDIMEMAGIHREYEEWDNTIEFLKKFEALHMLQIDVTHRNAPLQCDVTLVNFSRRQEQNLSNAERQKRYRDSKKKVSPSKKIKSVTQRNDSNVTQSNDSNARVEESRVDKNREDTIKRKKDKERKISLPSEATPSKNMQEFLKIYEEKGERYIALIEKISKHGIEITLVEKELKKFVSYWVEKNKSGTKQRWELQKVFEVQKRLSTWFSNINKFTHTATRQMGFHV